MKKLDLQQIEQSECTGDHEHVTDKVKNSMPDEASLYELAEVFKILSDHTRVKILYALLASDMCVCDIAALLGMTQSAISHQLRILKQARLVKFRRQGKAVFYSLDDEHVKQIFDQALIHINEL
jgi:ArsR family transcriptional regulator